MCASQAFKFALLQGAQQFRLNFSRNVSYFIQEQRALVGEFQSPDFLRNGSGERSLFVPKEFAFQQPRGDRGTIQLHKRAVLAPATFVNCACNELLPRSGLAEQKNRGIARGNSLDQLQHAF